MLENRLNKGLDYFPLDLNFYDDIKFIKVRQTYGYLGEIAYVRLLCMIYSEGYCLRMSIEDLACVLADGLSSGGYKVDTEKMINIINKYGEVGLLDKENLAKDVITSHGIQKQFLLCVTRRKFINTSVGWLLTKDEELRLINKIMLRPEDL